MDNQEEKKTDGKKKMSGCACCALGCGVPLCAFVFLFLFYIAYHEFGENKETAPMYYVETGSNFCYSWTYVNRYFEFTISEQDFLNWCENRENQWKPIEIKTLPELPKDDRGPWDLADGETLDNQRREIPLLFRRYNRSKSEHKDCDPRYKKCQIDPTGKTDNSCFCLLDDGYYYESRRSSGGGVYVLYDREKQRCYIEWNSH
jgi:hypothetical protein